MKRIDYSGPAAPQHIQDLLLAVGGVTRTGLPMYRLVHAADRLAPSGGEWVDWSDDVALDERKDGWATPLRRVAEVRMSPRYPTEQPGQWVLERWSPPEDFGTPESWYRPKVIGGTMEFYASIQKYLPLLGEFPYEGDYTHLGYCFPTDALTCAVVELAVGRFERGLDEMPSTDRGRMLRAMYNANQVSERKKAQDRAHTMEMLDETDFAFGGRPFSAGSSPKSAHSMAHYAKLAGVRSHVR